MAVKTAGDASAYTPEQFQIGPETLKSRRRVKTEVLAGLVVALALIPEAIAFSIIAGVDPRLGLFEPETLQIIFPFALAMAFVGLLESRMTARLVDDVTDTRSHKSREAWGQGVATSSPASPAAMATVTMKSNAFSPKVLLPETRRTTTKAAYETEPMIRMRRISAHESNRIGFLPGTRYPALPGDL